MPKFILLGIVIVLIIGAVFFPNLFSNLKSSHSNTEVMYGYRDYDDYLKNRPAYEKSADEELIKIVDEAIKKGNYKDRAETAQHACDAGFGFINNRDRETAIKRFNQAWLLDHNQPCAYSGFGYYLGGDIYSILGHRFGPSQETLDHSFQMYEKALSLSDPSSQSDYLNPWSFYLDYAEVLHHCYFLDSKRTDCLDKASSNLEKALALKDTYRVHRVMAFIAYDKKDYAEAWRQVHLGTNDGWGAFISDLKKEMPDPQGKY